MLGFLKNLAAPSEAKLMDDIDKVRVRQAKLNEHLKQQDYLIDALKEGIGWLVAENNRMASVLNGQELARSRLEKDGCLKDLSVADVLMAARARATELEEQDKEMEEHDWPEGDDE